MNRFRGIIPPLLTIFKSDGSFDFEGNKALMDYVISKGVHGVFVLGSIGEFAHLTTEERRQFAEFAVEAVAGRVPLLVGTGGTNTREVVELTRHAKEIGADAVVIVTPYYWTLSQQNLYRHYATVADAVDIPILIYNFPNLTGNNVSPSLVADLVKKHGNIVGIKDTIDSVSHIRELVLEVKSVNPDFSVLAGFDDHVFNTLAMGGDGAIPGSANFAPQLTVGMFESFSRGDLKTALEFHRKLLLLPRLYGMDTPAIGVIKAACKLCGVPVGYTVRQPAGEVRPETLDSLKALLEQAELI
ncbi:MAG TPA: 4-hydroxy-tetrahydrodipicolinate synthase [Firmicutes bacterium]|nr:4-hydroxy-tetrahydrodipicolinate synthase [Bacillota bacterium]